VQVCTAAMHYGYRMVEDMIDGLSNWMDEKGFRTIEDFRGLSLPRIADWKNLDLNYKIVARIHADKCIGCDLCYIACWDGAHQCIHVEGRDRSQITVTPIPKLDSVQASNGKTPPDRIPRVDEVECVGCNLCWLVCPVEGCITMEQISTGLPSETWAQRVGGST
jgi:dihydropyrimidine dehydrogenase (NAD+) subunit PreA